MGSLEERDGGWQGPLLTVKQAARRLGLTEWQLRHSIEQGYVPAVRVSEHRLRVRVADVESIVATTNGQTVAAARLAQVRALHERLEQITEEVKGLAEDCRRLLADLGHEEDEEGGAER